MPMGLSFFLSSMFVAYLISVLQTAGRMTDTVQAVCLPVGKGLSP